MVHELCVTDKSGGVAAQNVWREVRHLMIPSTASVYRTTCGTDQEDNAYVLATESKDLHALIGLMSDHGRNQLCRLFEREFKEREISELVFGAGQYGHRPTSIMHVTFSPNSDGTILFMVSPIRHLDSV